MKFSRWFPCLINCFGFFWRRVDVNDIASDIILLLN
jgi:hypothetical protein